MKTFEKDGIKINLLNNHYDDKSGIISNFFISRESFLGNPFTHLDNTKAEFKVESREIAVKKYEEYFKNKFNTDMEFKRKVIEFIKWIKKEKEVNLICWCVPNNCHGEFLIKFIFAIISKL